MKYLLPFWMIAVSSSSYAKQVTFEELWQQAEGANLSLKESQAHEANLQSQLSSFKWQYLPSLQASISESQTLSEGSEATMRTSPRANLSWDLFAGLSTPYAKKEAESSFLRASSQKEQKRRDTASKLNNEFVDWQTAYRKKNMLISLLQVRKKAHQEVIEMTKRGEREQNDPLLFENQLLNVELELSSVEEQILKKISSINDITQSKTSLTPADTPDLKQRSISPGCKAKNFSWKTHPSIEAHDHRIESLKAARAQINPLFMPRLGLTASKTFATKEEELDSTQVTATLTIPLFDRLQSNYRRKNTAGKVAQERIARNASVSRLVTDYKNKCATMSSLKQRVAIRKKRLRNETKILRHAKVQFETGGMSTLDYIDQQLRHMQSQIGAMEMEASLEKLKYTLFLMEKKNEHKK